MANKQIEFPYMNFLLETFGKEDSEIIESFGRHAHWGYWEAPTEANGSVADFAKATEEMCRRVYVTARVGDGQSVLDVGCGFGGAIASINERFKDMNLVGLNIDERQLERARNEVKAAESNQVEFVWGDACQLPFAENSFDVVLANECIFHFPSREQFFTEAKRVLRSGGRLAISDYVPTDILQPFFKLWNLSGLNTRIYGKCDQSYSLADYRRLARESNLTILREDDITVNTLPTYPFFRQIMRGKGRFDLQVEFDLINDWSEWSSAQGLMRYMIFSMVA